MKTKKTSGVFARPVQLVLCAGAALLLSTSAAFGQAVSQPAATTSGTDVVQMQKFDVTGSRIHRVDTETVSPVIQMSQASIEAKGFTTFGDAIRSLSINTGQALTPVDAGTSFTPGISTFNFRGLGNNSTLVLINGRRAAVYPIPGFDGLQSMFDLNGIPLAAIESVEILKDGGSAIYGSDAVAGVLNIKLRKDYQGSQASVGYGTFFNTGTPIKQASIIAGAASGKASIFVAANWTDQGYIMANDLSYTRDADFTSVAHKASPRYAVTGKGKVGDAINAINDAFGFPALSTNPAADGDFDNRSGTGFPGYIYDDNGDGPWTFYTPTNNPTLAGAQNDQNLYNFNSRAGFLSSNRNYAFFTRASYDFNDYVSAALEAGLTRSEGTSASAPTPVVLQNEQGLSQGSPMYIPADNPYNPWGADIYQGGRRLVETPDRYTTAVSDVPRMLLTLNGKFPENVSVLKDWTWEVGALYMANNVSVTTPGTVPDYRMQQALLGLVPDSTGKLQWVPDAPASSRTYFNWFGLNSQTMADFLSISNPQVAKNQLTSYDFHLGGPVAHLPGGDLAVSIGAEHYTQSISFTQTDLNITGNIIGGSNGGSWAGSRSVDAVYAEVDAPIVKWAELQVAGRYESYSDDGFQKRVRPKIGVKFHPLDWLIIRGSYSQAYQAPDLAYLNETEIVTFTPGQYHDPAYPAQPPAQMQMNVTGDPNLQPQTTDVYFAGIFIEPHKGVLKGLNASLDYFRYNQKNLLAQLTDYYTFNTILNGAMKAGSTPASDPNYDLYQLFQSMVVRGAPSGPGDPGQLLYINNPYQNIQKRTQVGYDADVSYTWATKRAGQFTAQLQGTYFVSDRIDGSTNLGNALFRRFRGNLGVNWKYRDWNVNLNCVYIRGTDDYQDYGAVSDYTGDPNDDAYGDLLVRYHIADQYVLNAIVTYSGFWGMDISLGVTNILNQRPPVDPSGSTGSFSFVDGVNYALPASWILQISKKF